MRRIRNIMLMCAIIMCVQAFGCECFAASVLVVPSTDTIVGENTTLMLSRRNCTISWSGVSHKNKTGSAGETILCIPIKNVKASWTQSNFLTMDFTNAGIINGRSVDCKVTVDSITVSARKGSKDGETSDGYVGVCSIKDSESGVNFGITVNDGCGYRANKTIKHTITVTYHDSGQVVDLPFFQSVRDLDASASYYTEAWESVSGYSGTYYKYAKNYCTFSGNKVSAPQGDGRNMTGNDSMIIAGIYATTSGGKFQAKFYEGNSSTKLQIYSQYSTTPQVFVAPTKSVDSASARTGDILTYTITHTMGTFYENVMTVYSDMRISDKLPQGLDYISASVQNGAGSDITSQGRLDFRKSDTTVYFDMNYAWLINKNNYNGQKIKLIIKARVNGASSVIENTGNVDLDPGVSSSTNSVRVTVYQPETRPDPPVINPEPDPPVINPEPPVVDPEPAKTRIQIVKKVRSDEDQFTAAHGDVTFIFKIKEENTNEIRYRSVTFGEKSEGWSFSTEGSYVVATGPVEELPRGQYQVTEIPVSRFVLTKSTKSVAGDVTRFVLENNKTHWGYLSHNSIVINKLKEGAGHD